MSEAPCTMNYEAEYDRLRAEMCKMQEENCRYKALWQEAEREILSLRAQMEVVRLIFGRGDAR